MLQSDETEMWSGVTQELMSYEEDFGSSLKVRTPDWRAPAITALVKQLDVHHENKMEEEKRQAPKKKRVVAESPIKRQPSKKIRQEYVCTEFEREHTNLV